MVLCLRKCPSQINYYYYRFVFAGNVQLVPGNRWDGKTKTNVLLERQMTFGRERKKQAVVVADGLIDFCCMKVKLDLWLHDSAKNTPLLVVKSKWALHITQRVLPGKHIKKMRQSKPICPMQNQPLLGYYPR